MYKKKEGNVLIIALAFVLIGIFILSSITYFSKKNIKENKMTIKEDRDSKKLREEDYIILEEYCFENNLIICEDEEKLIEMLDNSKDKRIGNKKITCRSDLKQIKYYLNIEDSKSAVIYFDVVIKENKIILREVMKR